MAWPLLRGACPRRPANTRRLPCPLQPETSRRWTSAAIVRHMAYSVAKPRGTADRIISTGRPTTECCAELGLDSRTVSKRAQNLRRRPQARPVLRQRCQKRPSKGRVPLGGTIGTPPLNETQKLPTSFNVFEGNRPNMQVRKRCLPLYSHLQRKGPLANFIASGALLVG